LRTPISFGALCLLPNNDKRQQNHLTGQYHIAYTEKIAEYFSKQIINWYIELIGILSSRK
jgi:hypothetical protein